MSLLYNSFINDIYTGFSIQFLPILSLYFSTYQDIFSSILLFSPEIVIAFSDYFAIYYGFNLINNTASVCFDSYVTNLNYHFGEGIIFLFMFFFFS